MTHNGTSAERAGQPGQLRRDPWKGIIMTDFTAQIIQVRNERVNAANAIALHVQAATGDKDKAVALAVNDSNDATVAKYRERLAKQQAAMEAERQEIEAYVAEHVVSTETLTDEQVEEQRALYKAAVKEAKAVIAAADAFGVAPDTDGLVKLLTFSGSKSGGGQPTGVKRPRFESVALSVNGGSATEVKTLSGVSQEIKSYTGKSVSAGELGDLASKVAGTDIGDATEPVTFELTETDADNQVVTFTVTTTPKVKAA